MVNRKYSNNRRIREEEGEVIDLTDTSRNNTMPVVKKKILIPLPDALPCGLSLTQNEFSKASG